MTLDLDRRLLLKIAALGAGAMALPAAAQLAQARGFTHSVASGEPRQRSVLLWTRWVSPVAPRLEWQVSESPDFRKIAASGAAVASEDRDFCVKALATGLKPGRWYYYRFISRGPGPADPDRYSPVGRTRTLPEGRTSRFSLGVFTCSNLPFGFFNAYAHAAGRRDLDLIVHLGDYVYEYPVGTYPSAAEALAGRLIAPQTETVALADYRLRYAAYRSDPDLQALHRMFPMVMMWDDHESANDSWKGGAQNHDEAKEGPWEARKAAAQRACREWMPISDNAWEAYEIGDLATLLRPETRLTGRSEPPDYGDVISGKKDVKAALSAFRDGGWHDPERTMLGTEQEAWLAGALKRSVSGGTRWQVLAQQTIMGSVVLPPEAKGWIAPDAPEFVRRRSALAASAAELGLPLNLDAWDGYPAARVRLLQSASQAGADFVVLSGDSHNAWAFDLPHGGAPAGTEFAVHSVTSPGFEAYAPRTAPAEMSRALLTANAQLRWAEVSRRGYLTLTLTRDRAVGEWHFLDTLKTRSTRLAGSHRMSVARGTNRFA